MKKLSLTFISLCVLTGAAYAQNVKVVNPDSQPVPVKVVSGGGGGAGDASAANQTAVQANAGADATKAISVQGITGGKPQPVNQNQIAGTAIDTNAGNASAGTQRVVVATNQPAIPVTMSTQVAAANISTGQVTAGAAATLVVARATRRQVTIKNTDATNTGTIGPATVTTGNGMPVKPGESITVRWTGLIQVIANAGSPVFAFLDEYD
jgi:hypothetical protein